MVRRANLPRRHVPDVRDADLTLLFLCAVRVREHGICIHRVRRWRIACHSNVLLSWRVADAGGSRSSERDARGRRINVVHTDREEKNRM